MLNPAGRLSTKNNTSLYAKFVQIKILTYVSGPSWFDRAFLKVQQVSQDHQQQVLLGFHQTLDQCLGKYCTNHTYRIT